MPDFADRVVQRFESANPYAACLQEAKASLTELEQVGAADLLAWSEPAKGVERPPAEEGVDAADFQRG